MKHPRGGPEAASPLKGAHPVARQSRFHGRPRMGPFYTSRLVLGVMT